ncbi:MAG TPA: VOC family protein [Actinomycetota bacterium]|nr:VOC family protein [Actinomycetota bacterium]
MLDLPVEVVRMDHVAIATWDASGPARMLTEVLGARFLTGGDSKRAGFRWLQFTLPDGKIEVIEPLHDQGFLYRFLTRRGPGLHHVTLFVKDLAGSIPKLAAAGFAPVDVDLSHESWKEAFLHPRDTSGILIQLAQVAAGAQPPKPSRTLEEFLADRPGLQPD